MYRKGDIGHPWRRPLVALKKSIGLPLTRGDIQGFDIHALIQLINNSENPNLERT